MHTFSILGARGSMLVSGRECGRYGLHTTCMTMKTPQGLLAIDAGTGLPATLNADEAKGGSVPPLTILFTHFHMDHVVGLPLLQTLYNSDASIRLMGDPRRAWQASVRGFVGKPYWPVELLEADAAIELQDLPIASHALEIHGVRITWCPVWHPQECLAYRLEVDGKAYVVATDREHGHPDLDPPFVQFCRNADVLVHDAQYLPEEYPRHRGWGHSTFQAAAAVACTANVGRLLLTHHDCGRADDEVDRLVEQARLLFPNTEAAAEGMQLGG